MSLLRKNQRNNFNMPKMSNKRELNKWIQLGMGIESCLHRKDSFYSINNLNLFKIAKH